MRYQSTRGKINNLSFEQTVMMGLAEDGGLLLPHRIPDVSNRLADWSTYRFQELSLAVMSLFIGDEIPFRDLESLVQRSYSSFDHDEITPVVKFGDLSVLELFHGPTFAFKDVALQFLGNLFEYLLKRRNHPLNVLGATSGDTGSAAIYGLRGKENINVFMLHPAGRVSPIQEKQMTTILDENVHNIAVEGTFDDCQNIVKELFGDLEFKKSHHLGAVNSINWARVMAQIVYYFYAYFRTLPNLHEKVYFSVPTGNFGDILAGYYAKRMGLPVAQFILGTNQNDILHRFFSKGEYHQEKVVPSISPSIDIQISSNFERFLFYLCGEQPKTLTNWMTTFRETKRLTIKGDLLEKARKEIVSSSVSEERTHETIKTFHEQHGYWLDPHTAVGVQAAWDYPAFQPVICLATAHPAKFPEAVSQAVGSPAPVPPAIAELQDKDSRCHTIPTDANQIKDYLVQTLKN